MNRDVAGTRPPVGRERAVAVGLVLVAAVSPQVGAAFAVTLFGELLYETPSSRPKRLAPRRRYAPVRPGRPR